MKRILVLILVIIFFLAIVMVHSCKKEKEDSNKIGSKPHAILHAHFVGDHSCRSCHENEFENWKNSDHERAMAKATDETVRGDFSGVSFTHKGTTYRFYREGDKFMVQAPDPDGKQGNYQITYTFGWAPLQQYLVDFGKGKLQALNIAWDARKKRWFSLYPDQKIDPDDWLHWTNGAMNWNTMCADCHSTDVRQNYYPPADSFHTTWSSINVSCEACHGPGSKHVQFMKTKKSRKAPESRISQDLNMTKFTSQKELINRCARCHARREKLTGHYDHQETFLDQFDPTLPHPPQYFADGQIKQEDYTYSSFLQSKMFHQGVECINCHDPHSLKVKANVLNNSLCLQCHAGSYNTPKHFHHKPNTKASMCVSCHMPGRHYMQIDFRRDHSLRIPRPDLSVKYNTPNTCNNCHDSKSAKWAADAVKKWFGPDRTPLNFYFSETLAKATNKGPEATGDLIHLAGDVSQPAIARATALWYLGQFPNQQSLGTLKKALHTSDPLIRTSAAKALGNFPSNMKKSILKEGLNDSIRAVRLSAVAGLASLKTSDFQKNYQHSFKKDLQEYREKLKVNQYFPQGQMNVGEFYEKRGEILKAIQAYQQALKKDPEFNPARLNLAYLMNRQGDDATAQKLLKTVIKQEPDYGQAYYSMGLLLAGQHKLKQAVPYFKKGAQRMPQNDRLRYNWAIALQKLKRPKQAEQVYLKAINLAPENPDYRYGICTLYIQQKQYQKALKQARKLTDIQPNSRRAQRLLEAIKSHEK